MNSQMQGRMKSELTIFNLCVLHVDMIPNIHFNFTLLHNIYIHFNLLE
jgi:hypothetical protein